MNYLVFCVCGHALDRHDPEGCHGQRTIKTACPCTRDPERALEATITEMRTGYAYVWRAGEEHANRSPAG